jgi:hypothetical protein
LKLISGGNMNNLEFIKKNIKSCKNQEQLETSYNWIKNLYKQGLLTQSSFKTLSEMIESFGAIV